MTFTAQVEYRLTQL